MTTSLNLNHWIEVLDDLERGLERFEVELRDGEPGPLEPWNVPDDLGPLPVALRGRATSLSWRMTAVEQRARDRRDVLREQLDDLGRRRGAGAAYAASGPNVSHTDGSHESFEEIGTPS